MKIKDLVVGQRVDLSLVLASATIRQTKGKPPRDFLAVSFTDGIDTIDGVIWNYNANLGVPETKKVYDIQGTIGEYNGAKQINPTAFALSENQDTTAFNCRYVEAPSRLFDQAIARIHTIQHPQLRNITEFMYMKHSKAIIEASSAKGVHHVGMGGNLAHCIQVCDIAGDLALTLSGHGYEVSVDLVKAGALLHDIGKIATYVIDGAVVDYTFNGHMFDHILNGAMLMQEAAQHFDQSYNNAFALLGHIIASHHGKLEYGSPVTPKFAEAYVVNYADGISADMDVLFAANNKAVAENKPMTDKIYVMGNQPHILQNTVKEMLRNGN